MILHTAPLAKNNSRDSTVSDDSIGSTNGSRIKAARELGEGAGTYIELTDEKQVLEMTTTQKYCVVHYFHKDFARCKVMDSHLQVLAKRHIYTRFYKVNVENVPFLVTRLQIQVLPCVLPFIDGIGRDRIVGFEGLGGEGDVFATGMLEMRLHKVGVLKGVRGEVKTSERRGIMGFKTEAKEEGDESYDSDD